MSAWLIGILHWLGSPANYYRLAGVVGSYATAVGVLLYLPAAWLALLVVPADYRQGDVFRIMYTHVPAAWLSLMIYSTMVVCALVLLVWRVKVCEHLLRAAAPLGAWMTGLALLTGSIWGKPTWGAWWVWGDARLTSELILLFIYLGIIGIHQAADERRAGARAAALLTLCGAVNIPIVHYSVLWWSSLHQNQSVSFSGKIAIDPVMFWPLLLMTLAFTFLYFGLWHMRAQTLIVLSHPSVCRSTRTPRHG